MTPNSTTHVDEDPQGAQDPDDHSEVDAGAADKVHAKRPKVLIPMKILDDSLRIMADGFAATGSIGAAAGILKRRLPDRWSLDGDDSSHVFKEVVRPFARFRRHEAADAVEPAKGAAVRTEAEAKSNTEVPAGELIHAPDGAIDRSGAAVNSQVADARTGGQRGGHSLFLDDAVSVRDVQQHTRSLDGSDLAMQEPLAESGEAEEDVGVRSAEESLTRDEIASADTPSQPRGPRPSVGRPSERDIADARNLAAQFPIDLSVEPTPVWYVRTSPDGPITVVQGNRFSRTGSSAERGAPPPGAVMGGHGHVFRRRERGDTADVGLYNEAQGYPGPGDFAAVRQTGVPEIVRSRQRTFIIYLDERGQPVAEVVAGEPFPPGVQERIENNHYMKENMGGQGWSFRNGP